MESSKPYAVEPAAAKGAKRLDDRKVPEEVGGSAKPPAPGAGPTRSADDDGAEGGRRRGGDD